MTLNDYRSWALTEGHAGMESQCAGLAEAVGFPFETRTVQRPNVPWRWLPVDLWPNKLSAKTGTPPLSSPWPDLVISVGRGSVAANLAVRKATGGRSFNVHVQTPHVNPARFDLVVVPEHDDLRGPNVLVSHGALHKITRAKLDDAAAQFASRFAHLPHPWISVLVGGASPHQGASTSAMAHFADQLLSAAEQSGGSILLTPSRRTGKDNETVLRERLAKRPGFIWDGTGDNPYIGLLALADALVVTGDSVSMVSEACFTGKPVHVYNLEDEGTKMRRFQQGLEKAGFTRPFTGRIEQWSYTPLDETARIANVIREKFLETRR